MRLLTLIISCFFCLAAHAKSAQEYLPADADLDPSIPTPESVLGWDIGDWRISHDQLLRYMETLAASSDRISLQVIGHTHEKRPLIHLVFTSPDNQQRLETLRETHLAAAGDQQTGESPLVVWMGYSVHGNEASGSNAAPLVAYYLAASRSDFVTGLLDDSVILLDPSFNPDGLNRFATWSNANRSLNPVGDLNHRIHNEAWPQNRTNHYLFDLNRDWLPLVHPESRARIAQYHRWLPNVLTDHHEAGNNEGFFFQPGVPTRQNPLTTDANLDMTRALAGFHSRAMDAAGERYFTEDIFDDFYYGKGSTYPDINGGVGILFEQPRINGPVKNQNDGKLFFHEAISNQLRMSLSTIRGADSLRTELAGYQRGFYREMAQRAASDKIRAWVIGDDGDPARARSLLKLLQQHQVEYQPLAEDIRADGQAFTAGHAWVIPARQRQYGLVKAMMQRRTSFQDETFYDVSAWTLPLAWNLPYASLTRVPATNTSTPLMSPIPPDTSAVAWLVPWQQTGAPALLQKLLDHQVVVRTASEPFSVNTASGLRSLKEGTLMVHAGIQTAQTRTTAMEILSLAATRGVDIVSAESGMTPSGPDLGSADFHHIAPLKPLLISGEGTSAYSVGEAWHHLDQRLGVAPVMVEMHRLHNIQLSDYTHLLMTDGSYSQISKTSRDRITTWIKNGGILVTTQRASVWAERLCFSASGEGCESGNGDTDSVSGEPAIESRPYGQFPDDDARMVIGGAIVAANIDLSHPLAWGYQRRDLPLFRQGAHLLRPSENPYSTPVRYTDTPLMSGFMGEQRQDEIRGQAAVIAERQGKGLVVRFANNPLFRGFWRGTERLWVNALYMGQAVETTTLPD